MELPNAEAMKAIREADAAMGADDELRWFTVAYTHRRQLLAVVDAFEEAKADQQRLVRQLDVAINGVDGAAPQASLCDIVAQVEHMARVQEGQRRARELDYAKEYEAHPEPRPIPLHDPRKGAPPVDGCDCMLCKMEREE